MTEEEVPPSTVRLKAPAGVPVPFNVMVSGEVGSELEMDIVPERAPTAVGVNVTVTAQLAPGASVVTEHGVVIA